MLSRRDALRLTAASLMPAVLPCTASAEDKPKDLTKLFTGDAKPTDYRLGRNKTLDDYFPFSVPKTKEEWAARRERVREQVMVATGLWPMPEKTPLNPVIHGKIERDGYTIEKVFFASTPGHTVCGNLYRPAQVNPDRKGGGDKKNPAVLFAHGHWAKGRFEVTPEAQAKAMVARGEEPDVERATYFMQAIPATLAKLGFVVFQYDMVGYADSTAIGHVARSGVPAVDGFADAEGELRLQSLMGLQTLNSVRAVDFVCSLPDVDADKIGVTGASGGGTQTFLLAAIDDRIKAAVPAVMVSTAMQGGCVCENCSLLRVGTGNIELAGLLAPRALAIPSADDWTREIMTKGYPELKKLYKLLGAEENVSAKMWKLPHNYGRPSREYMYAWFRKHLKGIEEEYAETPFKPVPVAELSVFDDTHPRPKDELKTPELRKKLTEADEKAVKTMKPDEVRKALRAMVGSELPQPINLAVRVKLDRIESEALIVTKCATGRSDEADAVPYVSVSSPKAWEQKQIKLAVWLHPEGKSSLFNNGKPVAAVQLLLDADYVVSAPDLLGVGEAAIPGGFKVNATYAGFTYGYNRSLLAQRVHDALTSVTNNPKDMKEIALIGVGEMGPVAILAKALAGDVVGKLVADRHGLDFAKITKTDDPFMLPGALKYGGLEAFIKLCGDKGVTLFNADGKDAPKAEKLVEAVLK
jgi:hypothetical protein